MEHAAPPAARLLVVERDPSLRAALLALLAEEGYGPSGVSSLEDALAALAQQSFALVLADLFTGHSRHAFTPAHILRRRAQPIPLGLLTTSPLVLEQPQRAGVAFAVAKPVDPTVLLTEIAACLKSPLSELQQRQAQTIQRFLEAWGIQAWRKLVRLCTEEVVCYPASLVWETAGNPARGKLALLARFRQMRLRYHSLRIEAQGICRRPSGLAVRYRGCVAEFGKDWEWVSGVALFAFAGERICQIGSPLEEQPWSSLLESSAAWFGLAGSS